MADEEVKKRALNIKRIRLEREKAVFMKLGGKLRAYLFTGILVTAPVAITFIWHISLFCGLTVLSISLFRRNISWTIICHLQFRGWVWLF